MSDVRASVVAVSRNDVYSFTKPVRDEIVLVAGLGVEGDAHAGVRVKHRGRVRADPTQPNVRQVHLIQAELFGEVAQKGYAVAAGQLGENVTTSGIDLLGLPSGTILRFGERPPSDVQAPGAQALRVQAPGASAPDGQAPDGLEALAGLLATADAADMNEATANAVAAVREAAVREAAVREAAVREAAVREAAVREAAVRGAGTLRNGATLRATTAGPARARSTAGERASGPDLRAAVVVAGLRNPCVQINGFQGGLLKEVIGRGPDGRPLYKAGVMAVVLRGGTVRAGDAVEVELPPGPFSPLERV